MCLLLEVWLLEIICLCTLPRLLAAEDQLILFRAIYKLQPKMFVYPKIRRLLWNIFIVLLCGKRVAQLMMPKLYEVRLTPASA